MGQKPSRMLSKNVKQVVKPNLNLNSSVEVAQKEDFALNIPMLNKIEVGGQQKSSLAVDIIQNRKTGGIPVREIVKTLRDYQVTNKLPSTEYEVLAKYYRPPVIEKEREDGVGIGHWVDDLHSFSSGKTSTRS